MFKIRAGLSFHGSRAATKREVSSGEMLQWPFSHFLETSDQWWPFFHFLGTYAVRLMWHWPFFTFSLFHFPHGHIYHQRCYCWERSQEMACGSPPLFSLLLSYHFPLLTAVGTWHVANLRFHIHKKHLVLLSHYNVRTVIIITVSKESHQEMTCNFRPPFWALKGKYEEKQRGGIWPFSYFLIRTKI